MKIVRCRLALAILVVGLGVAVVAAVVGLAWQAGEAKAWIRLSKLDFVPEVAYSLTAEDVDRFPLIGEVFAAYRDPSRFANVRVVGNTIVFAVSEERGMEATDYLRQKFEALGPNPARDYVIALAYDGEYFEWALSVV
jgi:hypothetical protein